MKPIKITKENWKKINDVLTKAQEKAKVRWATLSDVEEAVNTAEKFLENLLYKKDWLGLEFWYDPYAQSFSGRYTPMSTSIKIQRRSKGWYLIDVERTGCAKSSDAFIPVNLCEKALKILDYLINNATDIVARIEKTKLLDVQFRSTHTLIEELKRRNYIVTYNSEEPTI